MGAQIAATQNAAPASIFYQRVMRALVRADIPFLVGGTYAMAHYTGTERATKDLDLFLRRNDVDAAMQAIHRRGLSHRADASAFSRQGVPPGGGISWTSSFERQRRMRRRRRCGCHAGRRSSIPRALRPVEETIWSKAFVMERERFDGATSRTCCAPAATRAGLVASAELFDAHWRICSRRSCCSDSSTRPIAPAGAARGHAGLIARLVGEPAEDPARRPSATARSYRGRSTGRCAAARSYRRPRRSARAR